MIGELLVVTVPVGGPGQANRSRREGRRLRLHVTAGEHRAHLVGSEFSSSEPHQTLLGGAGRSGARELPAEHQIVVVASHAPSSLILAGEGARSELRLPLENVRRRLAGVAGVAVGVRAGQSVDDRLAEGIAPVHGPRVGLRPATRQVAAVVGVACGIENIAHRVDAVGVAMAVGDPDDATGVPADPADRFQVSARAEDVATEPEAVASVSRQREDCRVGTRVADHRVRGKGKRGSGVGVDHREPVAGVARAVESCEAAAQGDLRAVGRQQDRTTLAVLRIGRPGQQGAVGCLHGRELVPGDPVDDSEPAGHVDPGAGGLDAVDTCGGVGREAGDHAPVGRIQGSDPVAGLTVDVGEGAADVDARAVWRSCQRVDRPIRRRSPGVDQFTGGDVVGEEVRARRLVGARRGAGGACVVEFTAHVDRVAHDHLRPDHSVDLHGGQRIGRHCDRRRRVRFIYGPGVR